LLSAFEGDARVAPWHARKLTAALQHATSAAPGERPVVLRRERGVGHVARSASRLVDLWTEQLCFAAAHLGLAEESDGD
jgi:prolyl oligopeptidase